MRPSSSNFEPSEGRAGGPAASHDQSMYPGAHRSDADMTAAPQMTPADPRPAGLDDTPAEAEGRRILSTAFVMVCPDGRLTIARRDGRSLTLRDVVMRRKDYCGVQLTGDAAGKGYCGRYAEVAAARPGGVMDSDPSRGDPAPLNR